MNLHELFYVVAQVIVADNYFTGSKDNLKKWIGHPRFELIRHGKTTASGFFYCYSLSLMTLVSHYRVVVIASYV